MRRNTSPQGHPQDVIATIALVGLSAWTRAFFASIRSGHLPRLAFVPVSAYNKGRAVAKRDVR